MCVGARRRREVVRSGLEQLLGTADDIECVGSATDGADAVALTTERTPDVVLMDLSMPRLDGVEATRRIRLESPRTNVLVLTAVADFWRIQKALAAGAVGFLLKDAAPEELLAGIRQAARGEPPAAVAS